LILYIGSVHATQLMSSRANMGLEPGSEQFHQSVFSVLHALNEFQHWSGLLEFCSQQVTGVLTHLNASSILQGLNDFYIFLVWLY